MTKWMKKSVVAFLILAMTLSSTAYAEILWIDGGLLGAKQVTGGYEYQELCFITGEPVILKGFVTLPKVDKTKDKYTEKYSFELTNTTKGITLEREVTFDVVKEQTADGSQTTFKKIISQTNSGIKYEETVTTPNGVYTLAECNYSDIRSYVNSLASKYFNGNNAIYSKTYYKNGDANTNQGKIEIEVGDSTIFTGYDHIWGSNETIKAKYSISSFLPNPVVDPLKPYVPEWSGTFDIGMNTTKKVDFDFQYTNPQNMPFRRNFYKVDHYETVLTYEYNMPKDTAVNTTQTGRNIGRVNLSKEPFTESTPLNVPKIRDIGGHWAEEEIMLTTSLGIFDNTSDYFTPDAPISRMEFAKAMVGAIYGKLPEPTRTDVTRRRRPGVDTPYLDIEKDDPDYHYMEFVKEKEVMFGKNGYFKPNETLDRAEAISILIRALGIEGLAPAPPYKTQFVDDKNIPEWAKDSIYMANEIGLVTGSEGYVFPNRDLTKAEAAVLIHDFIYHLKDVINYDYREKILK